MEGCCNNTGHCPLSGSFRRDCRKLDRFHNQVPGVWKIHTRTPRVMMMMAVRASETSVYFNETTRYYIPEVSNLHIRRRENLKFKIISLTMTRHRQTVEISAKKNDVVIYLLRFNYRFNYRLYSNDMITK
jgi:hypothetical protein